MKCPNCGAEIGTSKFCQFCGSQITYGMKREQEKLNRQACFRCGSSNVQFKREKQGEIREKNTKHIINRTVGFCKDCGYTWYPEGANEASKKNNMVWWILGWIFFFPAPVMVLIWRKKNMWGIGLKIAVTVTFWLFMFIIGSNGNSLSTEINEANTPVIEQTTKRAEKSITVDGMSIITQEGHPLYFDNVEAAKEFYKDYVGNQVLISSGAQDYSDNTLITISGYSTKDTKIDAIQIYLKNVNRKIYIDEALTIAKDYLPLSLLEEYYDFEDSYILIRGSMHVHIIYYKITAEGYSKREETREKSVYIMPYDIYVWLWGDEDIGVVSINSEMDNSYWESNYKKNDIERVDWHYDFLE